MKVQEICEIFEGNEYRATWLDKVDDESVVPSTARRFRGPVTKYRQKSGLLTVGTAEETCDETNSLGSGSHCLLEADGFAPSHESMSESVAHIENIGDLLAEGGLNKKENDEDGSTSEESAIAQQTTTTNNHVEVVKEEPRAPVSPRSLTSLLVEQARELAQPHLAKAREMEDIVEANKAAEIKMRKERQIQKIELDARRSLQEIVGDEEERLMVHRLSLAREEAEKEQEKLYRRQIEEEMARRAAKEEKQRKLEAYEQRKRERAALKQQQQTVA